jgi:hypothetical protein
VAAEEAAAEALGRVAAIEALCQQERAEKRAVLGRIEKLEEMLRCSWKGQTNGRPDRVGDVLRRHICVHG